MGGCRFLASYLGNSNSFRFTSPRGSPAVGSGSSAASLPAGGSLFHRPSPSPPDSVRKQYRVWSGADGLAVSPHELAGRPGALASRAELFSNICILI